MAWSLATIDLRYLCCRDLTISHSNMYISVSLQHNNSSIQQRYQQQKTEMVSTGSKNLESEQRVRFFIFGGEETDHHLEFELFDPRFLFKDKSVGTVYVPVTHLLEKMQGFLNYQITSRNRRPGGFLSFLCKVTLSREVNYNNVHDPPPPPPPRLPSPPTPAPGRLYPRLEPVESLYNPPPPSPQYYSQPPPAQEYYPMQPPTPQYYSLPPTLEYDPIPPSTPQYYFPPAPPVYYSVQPSPDLYGWYHNC